MDVRPVEFVRLVQPEETEDELVNEAKALTWDDGVEHALVVLTTGERALVRGGRDGITFKVQADQAGGRPILLCEGTNLPFGIVQITWHTHPWPTGPSDGDREALRLLGQKVSRVYEFQGEATGTVFGPEKSSPTGGTTG